MSLQPLLSILTQPLTDLGAVHAVKEAARDAPDMILELYRHSMQLKWIPEVLHTFKHQVCVRIEFKLQTFKRQARSVTLAHIQKTPSPTTCTLVHH